MSKIVWFTGLPSSGKSTLARRVAEELRAAGRACCVLDGDEVRGALFPPLAYDDVGRDAFYETLARLAALLASQGLVVLVPATANLSRYRERARQLWPRLVEVHVATPVEVCAARDSKGLYAAAKTGAVRGLPGDDAGYEAPASPDVTAKVGREDDAIRAILVLVEQTTA